MWLVSLRDLQWRRRRFFIAAGSVALVLAMTLLLSGFSASFGNEVDRVVDSLGADAYLVADGAEGPFTATRFVPETVIAEAAAQPGVTAADGMLVSRFTIDHSGPRDVNVIGLRPGGIGTPHVTDGRPFTASNEAVADERVGVAVGDRVAIGGREFTVVGETSGMRYLGGVPVVFIATVDAQAIALSGQPLVSAVLVKGTPPADLAGIDVRTPDDVRSDLKRPLKDATSTINFVAVLLWLVAASIIGSSVYLTALERSRDFAVFKSTGMSTRALVGSVVAQAVVISLCAAAIGIVLAGFLGPQFPLPVETPRSAVLALPVLAVVAAVLASTAAFRRAVAVDPALAFRGP